MFFTSPRLTHRAKQLRSDILSKSRAKIACGSMGRIADIRTSHAIAGPRIETALEPAPGITSLFVAIAGRG
jgi:hypothetical protein